MCRFLYKWYIPLVESWPPERGKTGRWILGCLPPISFVIILFVLLTMASYDVVGIWVVFYIVDVYKRQDFHYAEPLTLAFFADMCHVTKSYLSSLFKKETGSNLTDYIHGVRIRHSLQLLNSTTLPIHVVANGCGYTDVNYFIKIFKRIHGISPKQYRNQMHKD